MNSVPFVVMSSSSILEKTCLFILVSTVACNKQTNVCPDVIPHASTSDFPMDAYAINEVALMGDELSVNVSYGGGCEQHSFEVLGADTIDGAGVKGSVLVLSHDANDDNCFAEILEHELCFNLATLADGEPLYFSHPDTLYQLN